MPSSAMSNSASSIDRHGSTSAIRWAIKSRKSRTSLIDSFIVNERLAKLVRKLEGGESSLTISPSAGAQSWTGKRDGLTTSGTWRPAPPGVT